MADLQSLRDAVRDTLSEDSVNLSDTTIDRLIRMATRKLQRDMVDDGMPAPRQMLRRQTITTDSSGVLTLPGDWLRARSVRSGNTLYKYVSTERLSETSEMADTDVDLTYYARIPDLQEGTTNWVLEIAEDVYIYAVCLQYAPWNRENGAVYGQFYSDALLTVCRANSATPRGGMVQQKRPQYDGFYTIYDESMIFGRL